MVGEITNERRRRFIRTRNVLESEEMVATLELLLKLETSMQVTEIAERIGLTQEGLPYPALTYVKVFLLHCVAAKFHPGQEEGSVSFSLDVDYVDQIGQTVDAYRNPARINDDYCYEFHRNLLMLFGYSKAEADKALSDDAT